MVDYQQTGVDARKKEEGLGRLLDYVNRTFALNACKPLLPIGYFANVIDLTPAGFPVGVAFPRTVSEQNCSLPNRQAGTIPLGSIAWP